MSADESELFQLFVDANGITVRMSFFDMLLYLSKDTTFAYSSLASEHLDDIFVDERSYAVGIAWTVDKLYHDSVFY